MGFTKKDFEYRGGTTHSLSVLRGTTISKILKLTGSEARHRRNIIGIYTGKGSVDIIYAICPPNETTLEVICKEMGISIPEDIKMTYKDIGLQSIASSFCADQVEDLHKDAKNIEAYLGITRRKKLSGIITPPEIGIGVLDAYLGR